MSDRNKNSPGSEEKPWLAMAGWLKDDPLFDEWQPAIREYRRQCDIEEGIFVDPSESRPGGPVGNSPDRQVGDWTKYDS
jgi:hypothetical protein